MPTKTVHCAKLRQELPAIDPESTEGSQALRTALVIGGPTMRDRVAAQVSQKAWEMWKDHMIMVFNEYRLDPMSDEANRILAHYMEAFFFGEGMEIPNYVPPK